MLKTKRHHRGVGGSLYFLNSQCTFTKTDFLPMKSVLFLIGFSPLNLSGDIAEAFFITQAMKQAGLEVFIPFGHRSKIDVVVRAEDGPLIGVQVKKATLQARPKDTHAKSYKFLVGSCKSKNHHNPEAGPRLKLYKQTDFDILAAVIMELDVVAMWPIDELLGSSSKRWNERDMDAPRNNWDIITKSPPQGMPKTKALTGGEGVST